MRCRSALTRVDALRTGELEATEHGELRDHLKTCRSCNASLDDVAQLAQVVKSLTVTPPRALREACCADCIDHVDQIDDVWVAFSDRGLRMIHRGGSFDDFAQRYVKRYGRNLERGKLNDALRRQMTNALRGEGVDKPLLDLDESSELEMKVMTLHYADEVPLDAVTRVLNLENASGAKAYIVSARRKLARAAQRLQARGEEL